MARRLAVLLSVIMSLPGACSSDEPSAQADAGRSSGAPSPSTCDGVGVCGDGEHPGCQGCAIATTCAGAWEACQTDTTGACIELSDCYLECPLGDTECYDACDAAASAEGVALLTELTRCVFCQECPLSCRVDTSQCR